MKTKLILTICSLSLGASGIIFTFAPDVILDNLRIEVSQPSLLLAQIVGGLYFGFSMLNWMVKESRIGGIYNRPIVIANLSHFLVAGLVLIKVVISNPAIPLIFWIVGILSGVFALLFALILFRDPINEK